MADIIPFGTPNQAGNQGQTRESGFTPHEFRRLDGLFLRAASAKAIAERTVNVTFEQKEAEFGYYKTKNSPAYLTFFIKQVGPQTMMYEVYKDGKGRIAKSGLFEKAFEKLEDEIHALLPETTPRNN
jgi:hypothetical protein